MFFGDLGRPIYGSVIRDDNLALDIGLAQSFYCLIHASRDGFFFVKAWYNDGDLELAPFGSFWHLCRSLRCDPWSGYHERILTNGICTCNAERAQLYVANHCDMRTSIEFDCPCKPLQKLMLSATDTTSDAHVPGSTAEFGLLLLTQWNVGDG